MKHSIQIWWFSYSQMTKTSNKICLDRVWICVGLFVRARACVCMCACVYVCACVCGNMSISMCSCVSMHHSNSVRKFQWNIYFLHKCIDKSANTHIPCTYRLRADRNSINDSIIKNLLSISTITKCIRFRYISMRTIFVNKF